MRSFTRAALLVVALGAAGCSGQAERATGGVNLQTSVSAVIGADPNTVVASITYSATGPDGATVSGTITDAASGVYSKLLTGLVPGDWFFTVTAFDAGGLKVYEAVAQKVTVTANRVVTAILILQQTNAAPSLDVAPFISSIGIVQGPPLGSLAVYELSAFVGPMSKVAGGVLTATWTLNDPTTNGALVDLGAIVPDPVSGLVTNSFTASADGDYLIKIEVTDGVNTASYTFTLRVTAFGSIVAVVDFNTWPVIAMPAGMAVTANGVALPPNAQPVPGDTITVTATATDPDGDYLGFAWTQPACATGPGTADVVSSISGRTVGSYTFTVAPAAALSTCDVRVAVQDYAEASLANARGGSTTGTLTLTIGPPAVKPQPVFSFAAGPVAYDARLPFDAPVAVGVIPAASGTWSVTLTVDATYGFGGTFDLGATLPDASSTSSATFNAVAAVGAATLPFTWTPADVTACDTNPGAVLAAPITVAATNSDGVSYSSVFGAVVICP